MKKLLFATAITTVLFACSTSSDKTASATASNNYPANATGYNLDSSENINAIQKVLVAGISSDSNTIYSIYTPNAEIYDNNNKITLADNFKTIAAMKAQGLNFKIDSVNVIWESVLNKPDPIGATSYVHTYVSMSVSKAEKKKSVMMNGVFAFKDGKVFKEWDVYDGSAFLDLLK